MRQCKLLQPRFVTYRAAALYALRLGSREQWVRLEDVVKQLDAHAKGQCSLDEGYRQQLDAERDALLAVLADPLLQPPRYEVLTPVAESLVASFSFPADEHQEQVEARRAAAQAASAWGAIRPTCI
jgi:hypothetical protein